MPNGNEYGNGQILLNALSQESPDTLKSRQDYGIPRASGARS